MAMHLKPKPGAMKSIAREMANEFSYSCMMPMVCQHVLRLTNVLVDTLSRTFEPNARFFILEALNSAVEVTLATRSDDYYVVTFRAQQRRRRR